MDDSSLTNINLKPGWGTSCPNPGAEHEGDTDSAHSLSLCPSSHGVLITVRVCHRTDRSSLVAPVASAAGSADLPVACSEVFPCSGGGTGVHGCSRAPGCSGVLACWSSLPGRPPQHFHLMLTSFTNTDSLGSQSRWREQGPFCGRQTEPPHCSSFPPGHPPSHDEI